MKTIQELIVLSIFIIVIIGMFALFGICFDYNLWNIFGKDIPWYYDVMGGAITSPFQIQLTIIVAIVKACGVVTPFI